MAVFPDRIMRPGLAIAQQSVWARDGRISIAGEVGRGGPSRLRYGPILGTIEGLGKSGDYTF